ncbi:hypothetical protein MMC26_004302 [Xylographa opegraphella]|nr:hypothetical protein [Xylographa opegraphella]
MSTYTIRPGDTLSAIATGHSIALDDLLAANPGIDPQDLQISQVINLPRPSSSTIPNSLGGSSGSGEYVQYSGPASNFPNPDQWASYDRLWTSNERLLKLHDSDTEIGYIKTAIGSVAADSGVDARAILCIIVQESGGDVHVGSTNNGVHNPGLMQSHNGVSFDANDAEGSILQMVRDGTEGTKDGDGLKQLLAQYGNFYEAFRAYNSGAVNTADMNDPKGATASYVRDAANRLMGHEWNGM